MPKYGQKISRQKNGKVYLAGMPQENNDSVTSPKAEVPKPQTPKGRVPKARTSNGKAKAIAGKLKGSGIWQGALAALITGVFSFAVAWSSARESLPDYEPVDDLRRSALAGTWTGTYDQPVGPNGQPIVGGPIQLTIKTSKKLVTGTGVLTFKSENGTPFQLHINFRGGFLHGQYLRLEYESADATAIQFGSLVAKLSADSHELTGSYVGFGAQSEKIVHGTASLRK